MEYVHNWAKGHVRHIQEEVEWVGAWMVHTVFWPCVPLEIWEVTWRAHTDLVTYLALIEYGQAARLQAKSRASHESRCSVGVVSLVQRDLLSS